MDTDLVFIAYLSLTNTSYFASFKLLEIQHNRYTRLIAGSTSTLFIQQWARWYIYGKTVYLVPFGKPSKSGAAKDQVPGPRMEMSVAYFHSALKLAFFKDFGILKNIITVVRTGRGFFFPNFAVNGLEQSMGSVRFPPRPRVLTAALRTPSQNWFGCGHTQKSTNNKHTHTNKNQ